MKKLFICLLLTVFLFGYGAIITAKNSAYQNEAEEKGPLTKISFVHYKNNASKSGSAKNRAFFCYDFLVSGAKWKTTEDYIVNPTNSGADVDLTLNALSLGVSEWEKYGGSAIFGSQIHDPLAYTSGNVPDNKNVVYFASYPDNRVIAVTTIWGYFGGSQRTRQIVEWDMQFNTFFQWGDAELNSAVMDLQNIATHELGHSAGMDDLYNSFCDTETMFGYSAYGETSKRDLHMGDIMGIQKLY